MTVTATPEQIPQIVNEAQMAARDAALRYYHDVLGGQDRFACGFAWVNIYGIKGNTRLGKALSASGVKKNYSGGLQLWNPSCLSVQNVDCKEAGAEAAAQVFKKYGFEAYAGSRLD